MNILWDNNPLHRETTTLYIRIRAGYSVSLSNHIEALKRTHLHGAIELEKRLQTFGEALSQTPAYDLIPNVPEFGLYQVATPHGTLNVVYAWGVVLSGSKRGKQHIGEYRFVVCLYDEMDEVLSSVFDFERVFERIVDYAPQKLATA